MTARFVRCRNCADGEPPEDLPAFAPPQIAIAPSPLVRAGVVKLPFDYRMAQAGREPGSDDE